MGKDSISRETMGDASREKQTLIPKMNVGALIIVIASLVLANLFYILYISFFDFEIHYPTVLLMFVLVIHASIIRWKIEKTFESPRT